MEWTRVSENYRRWNSVIGSWRGALSSCHSLNQQTTTMPSVLCCCLGNIARSPMAEAVLRDIVKKRGIDQDFDVIDSCGTAGYHIGEEPDERSVSTSRLERHKQSKSES